MELNKYILAKAIEKDICQEWADKIAISHDSDELMQMYVSGIDFCLSNNFPSNKDMQDLAGDIMNQYGVYIDQNVKLHNRGFLVFLGECTGQIKCDGYSVTKIHTKHNSNVMVEADDNAFVAIDCLDNSVVEIIANGNSNVYVSLYSNAKVTKSGTGIIKVVNKFKETY